MFLFARKKRSFKVLNKPFLWSLKIIIAKNIGGVFDQLKDLDKIYKIEEKDMDQLSEKIEQIMQLEEDYKENLVNIGRDHVRNNFSLHNMTSGYVNFYEKISI